MIPVLNLNRKRVKPLIWISLRIPRIAPYGNCSATARTRTDIDLVQTAPNVTYEIVTNATGETLKFIGPRKYLIQGKSLNLPTHQQVNLVQPTEFIGPVMRLCQDRRGIQIRTEYLSPTRTMLTYDLPLAEVIYDLYDKLKSATRGYGTMDYEFMGYQPADLVRLDILVNGNRVDARQSFVTNETQTAVVVPLLKS